MTADRPTEREDDTSEREDSLSERADDTSDRKDDTTEWGDDASTGPKTDEFDLGDRESSDSSLDRSSTEKSGEKFCTNCGTKIEARAEICPNCGVRQEAGGRSPTGTSEKEPGIAAVISLIIPGGGQFYNEQITRGAIVLGAYMAFWMVTFVLMFVFIGFLLMFAAPLFHIVAAWDAYDQAKKINAGTVVV